MGVTIAVQTFIKAEKTICTLGSLARCCGSNNYDLVILQDGCDGSQLPELGPHAMTTRAIESWIPVNRYRFASVRFEQCDRNYGPYTTVERLIDWAFATSESIIFLEDDVVFEQDALEWFEQTLAHAAFLRPEVWAVAGESKFFDATRHTPSLDDISRALRVAQAQRLMDRFVYIGFLPASCFATNREKWAEFRGTRGSWHGDRALAERCQAEGKLCLWPVIARCRDIGFQDPLGLSVRWRGENHSIVRNSYILSGMLEGGWGDLSELGDEKGALFNEFTRM